MAGLRSLVIAAVLLALMGVLAGCAKSAGMSSQSSDSMASDNGSAAPGTSRDGSVRDGRDGREGREGRDGRGRSAGMMASQGMGRLTPKELKEFKPVRDLRDIHFEFDRYDIGPEAARILDENAEWLRENPGSLVLIEGHADRRGTNEYNLALGDRRARASMNYLVAHGVRANRITTISYGEERALCNEDTDDCHGRNRRAHFAMKRQ
ncbi:MAG: OmpA family protein [Candidatus Rokuibacteriota bacterium]